MYVVDGLVVVQVVDLQGKLIQNIVLIYVITFILIKNLFFCTFHFVNIRCCLYVYGHYLPSWCCIFQIVCSRTVTEGTVSRPSRGSIYAFLLWFKRVQLKG